MRNKYLNYIENMESPISDGHEVEMSEIYVTHCRKGTIFEGHPERNAKHRPQKRVVK